MRDDEIYTKTEAGRDEIRSRALGLPMATRAILVMVDGQRSVGAMRTLIAGSKAPADVLDTLAAGGLIEPRVDQAAIVAAPAAPQPAVVSPAPPPTFAEAAPPPRASPPVAAAPISDVDPIPADAPLDLMLPTIVGVEGIDPAALLVDAPLQAIVADAADPRPADVVEVTADSAPGRDRYEHLYSMMNEVVRDFLAPHRRYFFQIKIERCTTPEELMELLHDLQTSLSKARGDAFASDVIARLRSAVA